MDDFLKGLLTVLLWFFTIGGVFASAIILVVSYLTESNWMWCAALPLLLSAVGEFIAFKFRD